MVEKAVNDNLQINLDLIDHYDLTLVTPLTSLIIVVQEQEQFPKVLRTMVFYILDLVFKEFDPLPLVDSNLHRRWAYFPDNEMIRNSFNWCQDDINQRNKRTYDA